jgi:hypothetical protein
MTKALPLNAASLNILKEKVLLRVTSFESIPAFASLWFKFDELTEAQLIEYAGKIISLNPDLIVVSGKNGFLFSQFLEEEIFLMEQEFIEDDIPDPKIETFSEHSPAAFYLIQHFFNQPIHSLPSYFLLTNTSIDLANSILSSINSDHFQ